MAERKCGACGLVAGTKESAVLLERSGKARKYTMIWCITCWLGLVFMLEDQSSAWSDCLPAEVTKKSLQLSRLRKKPQPFS